MNFCRLATAMALVGLGVFGTLANRRVVNPITLCSWPLAAALIGEILLTPRVPFGGGAALLLLCASIAVAAGCLLVLRRSPERLRVRIAPRTEPLLRWGLLIACAVLLGAAWYLRAYLTRTELGQVTSNEFARNLVFDEISGTFQGWLQRLTQLAQYLVAGPITLYVLCHGRWRWLIVTLYTAAVGVAAVTLASKLGVLIVLLISGTFYLVVPHYGGRIRAVRTLGLLALTAVAVLLLFSVTAEKRYGPGSGPRAILQLEYGVFGGPSALSVLVDEGGSVRARGTTDFGVSAQGLLELTGHAQRALGQFSVIRLEPGVPESDTNIYTGLYPLRLDFGYAGLLVILAALSALATAGHQRLFRRPSGQQLLFVGQLYLALLYLPNWLVSYYNFWWLLLAASPLIGRLFLVESLPPPEEPREHRSITQNQARVEPTVAAAQLGS